MTSVPSTLPERHSDTQIEPLLHDAEQVSTILWGTPAHHQLVTRYMRAGRWPSRKIGHLPRQMTDADIQAALEIEAVAATGAPPPPPASGVSPRSRARRAS